MIVHGAMWDGSWEIFSFESELTSRHQSSTENFHNLKKLTEEIFSSEECEDVKELDEITVFETSKARFKQVASEALSVSSTLKELKKNNELLMLENKSIQREKEYLEEEESRLLTEYKLQKKAYQKAIQKYNTHFDLDVDVKERSESLIRAAVKFGFSNDTTLELVVDKNNRKIIKFDSTGLLTKEEEDMSCSKDIIPEKLCTIRESLLRKNVNK